MKINMIIRNNQSGIALLITLLLMGVLLGIGATLLNVTLKQLQLSSIALESEIAFQAANAGVECALYYDYVPTAGAPFDVPGDGSEQAAVPEISCMGVAIKADNVNHGKADTKKNGGAVEHNGRAASTDEQRFRFDWAGLCTEVSVYKFFMEDDGKGTARSVAVVVNGEKMRPDCPEGSPGSDCTVIQSRGYNVACGAIDTGGRVVEREYTQVY